MCRENENWIHFIELVTSAGSMHTNKIIEITNMNGDVKSRNVFATAFPYLATHKELAEPLVWERWVLVTDMADRKIHFS